mgnify:FL=1
MRIPVIASAVLLLAGCGSYEYRDNSAAVDANPLCMSRPSQPGEPVSRDCERDASGRWSSERDGQPVDFKRTRDDH